MIFDLKNVNPQAIISVKLVVESGMGTIAAGVAKAKADKIPISRSDGGTGASPTDSMKYTSVPAEIGPAEMKQTLVRNRPRDRVRLQADSQLKFSRDILIGTLLGAEEYGFDTAALVALGCCMLRKYHTNTCPMGVATQDAELCKCFAGKPEHQIYYLRLLAEDLRGRMAQMGYRSLDELIGRSNLLHQREMPAEFPVSKLDLRHLLFCPEGAAEIRCHMTQDMPWAKCSTGSCSRWQTSARNRKKHLPGLLRGQYGSQRRGHAQRIHHPALRQRRTFRRRTDDHLPG